MSLGRGLGRDDMGWKIHEWWDGTLQCVTLFSGACKFPKVAKGHPFALASLWPVIVRVLAERDQPEAGGPLRKSCEG